MLLSFVQAVVACNATVPKVCTLVQAKIRQDTRLWHYSGLKPTMYASFVQAAVASNVTAPRVCTLVLFIIVADEASGAGLNNMMKRLRNIFREL